MRKTDFLKDVTGWDNHRHVLWEALKQSKTKVIELGCGGGSTPFIKKYCDEKGIEFLSYESSKEWADKYGAEHVTNWDDLKPVKCDLLFIDHAPGERRKEDVKRWANHAKLIVMHDTEPDSAGTHGYRFYEVFPIFKHLRHVWKTGGGGTGTSIASMFQDLSFMDKINIEGYSIIAP